MKVDDDDDGDGDGGGGDDIPYTDIDTHLHVQTYYPYLHVAYTLCGSCPKKLETRQNHWLPKVTIKLDDFGVPHYVLILRAASWPWWAPMAAASPRCCRIFRVGSSPRRAKYGCSPVCTSRWWSASDGPKSLTHGGAPPG